MARTSSIYQEEVIPSPLQQTWRNFSSYPVAMVGLWTIGILLVICLLAPVIAPYEPDSQKIDALLKQPSWHAEGEVEHFFGTDDLGRDVFSNAVARQDQQRGVAHDDSSFRNLLAAA